MPASLASILNPTNVSPRQIIAFSGQPKGPDMNNNSTSLFPYKRVIKACTQCRRDKTRCDKGRPCNGCVRKGRVESCIDGCVACRQARLSCDETRPCMSCVQAGCKCIADDPCIAATRKKLNPPAYAPLRRIKPHPRIDISAPQIPPKIACITCKRDDETCAGGIICRRCAELGEQCAYISQPAKSIKQRCALCRQKNKKCEHVRPCVHCVRANVPCIDLSRKGVGKGLRVKRACEACRAEKIQCEETRPCGGCRKKNIKCVERDCNACMIKGSQCIACIRQNSLHGECESSSTNSLSEDDKDNLSSLFSSPVSPSMCNGLPLGPSGTGKVQSPASPYDVSQSQYALEVCLSKSLDSPSPCRLPSLDSFNPYNTRSNYLSPPYPLYPDGLQASLASPAELPYSSIGFSLSSLTISHMRTRPISDVLEDYK